MENFKDFVNMQRTDEDILLSILPSNIWADTFKKLEKKHSSTLESLSLSSPYFRNLILSKRVLFLFPKVIKLIGPEFASQTNTKIEGSNIIKSRIVCKAWNKAVDQFITDDTLKPDFFNTEPPQTSDHALINARYQYFGNEEPTKLHKFLTHFETTHLPHSPRNPFIGKVIYIDLTGYIHQAEWASIADQVSTLLRKYGHHIKILNLSLFKFNPDQAIQAQNHSWLLEWLENCQNLTHLKVSERYNVSGEMDAQFGNCPNPGRTIIRRAGLELIDAGFVNRLQQQLNYFRDLQQHLDEFMLLDDTQRENPDVVQRLTRAIEQDHNHDAGPVHQQVVTPFPTLKNLECLKLCQLSSLNFNSLISANTHVSWLQIETLSVQKHMYVNYHVMEFPNLKKLYIKLCCPAEVRKLRAVHKSWLSLTHLHFEYCTSKLCCLLPAFTEWMEIFEVIDQNWGSTLTDLKLRLPVAEVDYQKELVVRDTGGQFRLKLPTLKRLKIWLDENGEDERVAKTDFLDEMKDKLEILIIK